jgi:hypothetical protein
LPGSFNENLLLGARKRDNEGTTARHFAFLLLEAPTYRTFISRSSKNKRHSIYAMEHLALDCYSQVLEIKGISNYADFLGAIRVLIVASGEGVWNMKRFFVAGLVLASLVSFMVDISYGEIYVICYRYGKGRCLKCKETVRARMQDLNNAGSLCHGVGKDFNTLDEAERWRALHCTCPGSK